MNLRRPPYPYDVEDDFGPYRREEVIAARMSLLQTLQREKGGAWQGIKYKLGIMPNGLRVPNFDTDNMWLPRPIPDIWSAPVFLHDPGSQERKESEKQEAGTRHKRGMTSEQKGDDDDVEPRWGLAARPVAVERSPSLSSTGGDIKSSATKNFLQKRKWDQVEESTLFVDDSDDDDMILVSSDDERVKFAKKTSGVECIEVKPKQFEVVFQCHFCSHSTQKQDKIVAHLSKKGHYAASRYLALKEGEELRRVYLSVASMAENPEHLMGKKVAACPMCHSLFRNIKSCLDHSLTKHKLYGQYSFRALSNKRAFELHTDPKLNLCYECEEVFTDKELKAHVADTKHMSLFTGQRSESTMMAYLCPFCTDVHISYFEFKQHVLMRHKENVESEGKTTLTGTCFDVGESQPAQTMLPKDPGIPLHQINYDFSTPQLPDDPGFRGAMTKCKQRRIKKLNSKNKIQGPIAEKAKKKKKARRRPTHKVRFARNNSY